MKEELLQLKQDIIDISNDLKTNLADKGVTADGTLSELVNKVPDIDSNVLGEIGWNLSEQPFLKDAIEYAKEIQKKPNYAYTSDSQLIIFPKIDSYKIGNGTFAGSSLVFFPDNVNLSGTLYSAFTLSAIQRLDLRKFTNTGTSFYNAFNNCKHLKNLLVNEDFGKGVNAMNSAFSNCDMLDKLDYLNTEDCTNMNQLFHYCSRLQSIPTIDVSNVKEMSQAFFNCKSLKSIKLIGTIDKITSNNSVFEDCTSLTELIVPENFPIIASSYQYGHLKGIKVPKIVGSFDYTKCQCYGTFYYQWVFGFTSNTYVRYMVIKNIGSYQSGSYCNMEYSRVWGIANDEVPDARQSLIDSLITYSYDRATAGYSTQTWKLYPDVKALLTEDEIAQITAKGYTLV